MTGPACFTSFYVALRNFTPFCRVRTSEANAYLLTSVWTRWPAQAETVVQHMVNNSGSNSVWNYLPRCSCSSAPLCLSHLPEIACCRPTPAADRSRCENTTLLLKQRSCCRPVLMVLPGAGQHCGITVVLVCWEFNRLSLWLFIVVFPQTNNDNCVKKCDALCLCKQHLGALQPECKECFENSPFSQQTCWLVVQ